MIAAAPLCLQAVAPVVCPVCGKRVSGINGKQKLRYHMLTHTGERHYQCPHCPHRASLKFNLSRHIRTVHKELSAHGAGQQGLHHENVRLGSKDLFSGSQGLRMDSVNTVNVPTTHSQRTDFDSVNIVNVHTTNIEAWNQG